MRARDSIGHGGAAPQTPCARGPRPPRLTSARARLQRAIEPGLERLEEELLPAEREVRIGGPQLGVLVDADARGVGEEAGGVEHRRTEAGALDEHQEVPAETPDVPVVLVI